MKFWRIYLLVFIYSYSFAQEIDQGNISFTLSKLSVQVPIDSISFNNNDEITIRAFGRITKPSCTMIILSIVLHRLSPNPQDLNIEKCWLSLDHKNSYADDFYLSFGFQDFFAFYSSQTEKGGDVKKIQATTSRFFISKIENIGSRLLLTGYFACSFVNIHNGKIEYIEIQDGNFTLVVENNKTLVTAEEENVTPSPFDPYIVSSQPAYYVVSSPLQSTSIDKEMNSDPSLPFPNQIQHSQENQAPQPEYKYRTIRTGRGTQSIISRDTYHASNRENQQSQDTTTQNQRTRASGVRRGGR